MVFVRSRTSAEVGIALAPAFSMGSLYMNRTVELEEYLKGEGDMFKGELSM